MKSAATAVATAEVWSGRFGDLTLCCTLPAEFGRVRFPWHGAHATSPDMLLHGRRADAPFGAEGTHFSALDRAHFVFVAPSCRGHGDWQQGRGELTLHDRDRDASQRVQMLQEGLFAAAYARILALGGLFLHAAVLWLEGCAFVVAGPSRAGKSTLCRRLPGQWWSDEFAFLVPSVGGWHVWRHAEFRGGQGDFPWRAPLAGLLWLGPERAQTRTRSLATAEALLRVVPEALIAGSVTAPLVLAAAAQLCEDHPVRELSHCLLSPPEAVVAAIGGGGG